MKVSLIVPAYNEEKNIAKTLESLHSQDYNNFELIVIDNNSTDKTSEIAKTFTSNVFLETQKGYIHAANRGVKEATGEVIAFCDADTIYPVTWASQMVQAFKQNPKAVAVYGSCMTFDASTIMNYINRYFYTFFLIISNILGLDNTSGFNFMMKKAAFLQVKGFDPNYQKMSPDIELGQRLKQVGEIIFMPKILVYSSFRRFQHNGIIKTVFSFLKAWAAMVRGKTPKTNYEEYNQEIR